MVLSKKRICGQLRRLPSPTCTTMRGTTSSSSYRDGRSYTCSRRKRRRSCLCTASFRRLRTTHGSAAFAAAVLFLVLPLRRRNGLSRRVRWRQLATAARAWEKELHPDARALLRVVTLGPGGASTAMPCVCVSCVSEYSPLCVGGQMGCFFPKAGGTPWPLTRPQSL